jgi:DNA-directed RNA polymerase specialized sigma24 family protein
VYGYCHLVLHDSADAAAALQDTFVIATATLGDLSEPSALCPWLFALARNECQRRIRTTSATGGDQANPPNQRHDAVGEPHTVDRLIDATMSSARSASRFKRGRRLLTLVNEVGGYF